MNESVVLLVGDAVWPGCILVIAIIVLITQRTPIGRLIDRIKSLSYPGGAAELGVVAEAGVNVISTLVESLPSNLSVAAGAGKRPADGQATTPIDNREPIRDLEPLAIEEVTSLVTLSTRTTNVLNELAFPPPPGGFGPVSGTIDVLRRRGVLETEQASALRQLNEIADEAARGALVPPRVSQAVQNSGRAILIQLDLLRTVAGRKFEEYVLDTLRKRKPDGWSMDTDHAIPRGDPAAAGAPAPARVDALVTCRDRSVVVEVRARLRSGAQGQIEAVREWLAALQADLPVLLVMLGERLSDRELGLLRAGREAAVELLLWDREEDALIMALRDLLERADVSPVLPPQPIAG